MNILITGASGFTGRHLVELLASKKKFTSIALYHHHCPPQWPGVIYEKVNLLHGHSVSKILKKYRPKQIYHLAGIGGVGRLEQNPLPAFQLNVLGTAILYEIIKTTLRHVRVLNAGSAEEYGIVPPKNLPIREDQPLNPATVYGISKLAQEKIALYHARLGKIETIAARTFHYTGPQQPRGFVFPHFVTSVLDCQRSGTKEIGVGNLAAKRDYLDVRDVVRAYFLLMQDGKSGEAYNVCSGQTRSIHDYARIILEKVSEKIRFRTDPKKMRKVDVPVSVGDNHKLRQATSWKPCYSFHKTIEDMFDYWRHESLRNSKTKKRSH